ncbi:MAG: hypothetical protein HY696_05555 [Deltaproteobacteria bacterium]|nr:hypothetical protein [Deltaproteobacteria bacterium]
MRTLHRVGWFAIAISFAIGLFGTDAWAHKKYKKDRDNNPPGLAGGRGTNWENPPGPAGGPGASPDKRQWRKQWKKHWRSRY